MSEIKGSATYDATIQLSQDEAVAFGKAKEWEAWSDEERARFQLYQDRLCIIPFSEVHRCMEKLLGRSVWTHEFADRQSLIDEYEGRISKASVAAVLHKLDKYGKPIILVTGAPEGGAP